MVEQHILSLPAPRLLAYYKKYYRSGRNPHRERDWSGDGPKDQVKYDEWEADRVTIYNRLCSLEHVEK